MVNGLPLTTRIRDRAAGVLLLSGRDRLAHLDRLSTNRVRDLSPGSVRATAVLTDAGRVVDVVACYAGAESALLLTTAPESTPVITAHLRRYILYDADVRVTDAGDQVAVLRVVGPRARATAEEAVAAIVGRPLAAVGGSGEPEAAWRAVEDGPWPVWLLAHPSPGGMGGVDVVVPVGEPAARTSEHLASSAGAGAAMDDGAYDALRVAGCLPRFGAEVDGASNPLELGLRPLVDFAKGCYIGQEIVARLDTYERVQRRLVRLEAGGPIAVGDRVVAAEGGRRTARDGRVTTVVAIGGRWRALALAPREPGAAQVDRRLVVAAAGGPVEARAAACDDTVEDAIART